MTKEDKAWKKQCDTFAICLVLASVCAMLLALIEAL